MEKEVVSLLVAVVGRRVLSDPILYSFVTTAVVAAKFIQLTAIKQSGTTT